MGSTLDIHILTVHPLFTADAMIAHVVKAPTAANGGGITILGAWATNHGSIGSGTDGISFTLLNYGSSGTASEGTIAATYGGAGTAWTAGLPVALTIAAAQKFIDAGEWVVVKAGLAESGAFTRPSLTVQYIQGRGI